MSATTLRHPPGPRIPGKVCSRIGLSLFFMMLAWQISATVIIVVIYLAAPAVAESPWFFGIMNDVPLYLIGMPVYLLILSTIPDGPNGPAEQRPAKRFHLGHYLLVLAFCFGATYLLSFLTGLVSDAVHLSGEIPSTTDILEGMMGQSGFLQDFIFIVCVPAVGEEFLFRYMLRRKLRGAGDKIYILMSALCFGLFHGNFSQIFYAFVVGAAFAWVYLRTGKIWIPMTMHFCINLFAISTPMLYQNTPLWAIILIVILLLAIFAIVIYFSMQKRLIRGMLPPTEPGWPYKPPKAANPWEQAAQNAAAHAYAYGGYAAQGPYAQNPYAHYGVPYAAPAAYAQPAAWQQPYGQQPYAWQPPAATPAPAYAPPAHSAAPLWGQPHAYGYAQPVQNHPPQASWQAGAAYAHPAYGQPAVLPAAEPPPAAYPHLAGGTSWTYHAPAPHAHYAQAASAYPYAQGAPAHQPYYAPQPGYTQAGYPYGSYAQPAFYPPHGYTYSYDPYGYSGWYYQKPPTLGSVCFGNVGMILYLVLTGLLVVATLFVM